MLLKPDPKIKYATQAISPDCDQQEIIVCWVEEVLVDITQSPSPWLEIFARETLPCHQIIIFTFYVIALFLSGGGGGRGGGTVL